MSDSALFMLAFDHRKSIRPLFGIEGEPDAEDRERITAAKELVYEGLLAAVPRLPEGAASGLLVDEEFGTPVLERARETDVVAAVAVERSGQAEFQFEYEDFAAHLERLRPELAKALVRYNVGGDRALNDRQLERLRVLSDRLAGIDGTDLLFELLVPPTAEQLAEFDGDAAASTPSSAPPSGPRRDRADPGRRDRGRDLEDRGHRGRRSTASRSPPPAAAAAAPPTA